MACVSLQWALAAPALLRWRMEAACGIFDPRCDYFDDADADGFYGGDRGDGRWSEDEEEEQLMEQHYAEEQAHDALRGQLGTAYDGGLLG